MRRLTLLALAFAAIVIASQFAPPAAKAQTVPPMPGCVCEAIDWPEPAPCPRIFLPTISR